MADAPATPTTPEPEPGAEFLHPHVIGEGVDNSAPSESGTPAPAVVTADQFNELKQTFNTFREESNQREQSLQQTVQQLMMRPAVYGQTGPAAPAEPAGLDLSDLPDPVQNPKEYNTALQAKLTAAMESASQSTSQAVVSQVSNAQVMNNLWTRFSGAHPELAKRQALVQGAGR